MMNSPVVGAMVAFSICNKPFKPLGLASGRVWSRERLRKEKPTKPKIRAKRKEKREKRKEKENEKERKEVKKSRETTHT